MNDAMTSTILKSLELLDKSRMFEVENGNGCYIVTFKDDESDYQLSAVYYEEQGWMYYIGGVYNNGNDWVCIDVGRLKELMSFCESLSGDAQ